MGGVAANADSSSTLGVVVVVLRGELSLRCLSWRWKRHQDFKLCICAEGTHAGLGNLLIVQTTACVDDPVRLRHSQHFSIPRDVLPVTAKALLSEFGKRPEQILSGVEDVLKSLQLPTATDVVWEIASKPSAASTCPEAFCI